MTTALAASCDERVLVATRPRTLREWIPASAGMTKKEG
jgi:hypothetical protein